jgi:hypothetical protein
MTIDCQLLVIRHNKCHNMELLLISSYNHTKAAERFYNN